MQHNTSFLMLRGLGRNQFHWGDHSKFYEAFGPSVHFIDFPGFGTNNHMVSPRTIPEVTEISHSQWEEKKIPENNKKILVGMSLGGMVALDWVNRYPEEWDGLILINSSVRDLSPFWQRLRYQNYFSLLRILLTGTFEEKEETIFDLTCNLVNKQETLKAWNEISQKYPVDMSDIRSQLYGAGLFHSPSSVPAKLKTLVLTSKKDRLVSYRCSKSIAKKYKANIRVHRQAGHDLVLDDWPWCAQMINAWLANPWTQKIKFMF